MNGIEIKEDESAARQLYQMSAGKKHYFEVIRKTKPSLLKIAA